MSDEPKDNKVAEPPLAPATAPASALPEGELARLTDDIVAALKTVYDPEIRPTSTSLASFTRSTSPTTAR